MIGKREKHVCRRGQSSGRYASQTAVADQTEGWKLLRPGGCRGTIQSGAPKGRTGYTHGRPRLERSFGLSSLAQAEGEQALEQLKAILRENPKLDAFISTDGALQFPLKQAYDTFSPLGKQISTGEFAFLAGGILPEQIVLLKKGLSSGQVGTDYSRLDTRLF